MASGGFRFVGTSMGGILGMLLAAGPLKERISHLVLNDIGPELPAEAARRIGSYVGNPPVFDTIAEFESWIRQNYAPFGRNSETFWRRMVDTSLRRTDAGKVTVHYDPAIVAGLRKLEADADSWPVYDAIAAPTLLLRGEHSDVLAKPVATAMTQRGPKAELREMPGVGHAPTLASAAEIDLLRAFLAR